MITLESEFKIISSPETKNTTVGIVGIYDEPYNLQYLKNRIGDVVESFGDSLKRAYEVKTLVRQPEKSLLSTKVIPIEAEIDKREVDINTKYFSNFKTIRKMREVCIKISKEGKENAIIYNSNKIYFYHVLKRSFDPESTGNLLKAVKAVLFEISGQKCKSVKSEIMPNYLKVDAEIRKPTYEISV